METLFGFLMIRNPVAAGTHFFFLLFAVYATPILWKLGRGDRVKQLSVGVFGLSMVLLYAASSTYHAVPEHFGESVIGFFRNLDHTFIFILIAGTYTPIFAVLLRGRLRVTVLSMMWALALTGIAFKWLTPQMPYRIIVGLYIAVGLLGLVPLHELIRSVGWRPISEAVAGGMLYILGGVCDLVRWPNLWPGVVGHHDILHLFTMAGTWTHFTFVVRHVLPFRRPLRAVKKAPREVRPLVLGTNPSAT